MEPRRFIALMEMPYITLPDGRGIDLEIEQFVHSGGAANRSADVHGLIRRIYMIVDGQPVRDHYNDVLQLQGSQDRAAFKLALAQDPTFNAVMQRLGMDIMTVVDSFVQAKDREDPVATFETLLNRAYPNLAERMLQVTM